MKIKMPFVGACTVAGLLVLLASCSTFEASGLQMGIDTMSTERFQIAGQFETSVGVHRFLGSSSGPTLFNISSAMTNVAVSNAIQEQIVKFGGTGVTNVSINYRSHLGHWILNWITFSIWAPSKVIISGTVIREQK